MLGQTPSSASLNRTLGAAGGFAVIFLEEMASWKIVPWQVHHFAGYATVASSCVAPARELGTVGRGPTQDE